MSAGGEKVEVLYDYSYSDDQGLVEIREGDVYKLVERTNSEWWHVCPLDESTPSEDDGFFVPAQYVRVLKRRDETVDNPTSSHDGVAEDEEDKLIYENNNFKHTLVNDGEQLPRQTPLQSAGIPETVNGMGKSVDTEGEYINLDEYRAAAKIHLQDNQKSVITETGESDYANLPFQQRQLQQHHPPSSEQGPHLADGHFVRELLAGLPWDIYEDKSKRKFFHNRETGELTWKPPRKDKPTSPVTAGPTATPSTQIPKFPSQMPSVFIEGTEGDDPEYTITEEGGDVFYIHNSTNEKWQQLKDETGRQYFHRLGSNDTQWDLPLTPRSRSEGLDTSPRNDKFTSDGRVTSSFSGRPVSMYGKIERGQADAIDPKACTLPPNFSPGSQIEKSPSLPSFQLKPPGHQRFEDQFNGYLQKTKIADIGRKKIKKNWEKTYAVLQASNLVFYKDQKAAMQKPGSPHGKPELVIGLQGAKVDFNPRDITSKRNTILLSVSSGGSYLLYHDDEKTIHEWLVHLKVAANDLSQGSSPREVGRSGVERSMSEGGSSQGADAGARNMMGIKAKLLSFLNRRPTQEDLIKQGIIKDAVFGSTLQSLCDRDKCTVPNFVMECVSAVEDKGLEHDGLYRISGNLAEIQRLRYVVDKDDDHNLADEQWDIHTLTGALKLFFRELKEPLFPFKCVDKFLSASKRETRKEKMKAFKEAVSTLPKCNYDTLKFLLRHLKKVVSLSAENRMQTQNVAIVFGPTLMWMEEGDFSNMAILTVYQSKVVEFLLLEFEHLFQ